MEIVKSYVEFLKLNESNYSELSNSELNTIINKTQNRLFGIRVFSLSVKLALIHGVILHYFKSIGIINIVKNSNYGLATLLSILIGTSLFEKYFDNTLENVDSEKRMRISKSPEHLKFVKDIETTRKKLDNSITNFYTKYHSELGLSEAQLNSFILFEIIDDLDFSILVKKLVNKIPFTNVAKTKKAIESDPKMSADFEKISDLGVKLSDLIFDHQALYRKALKESKNLELSDKIDAVYESEDFYGAYEKLISENTGSTLLDAFKRNPDETTGKKIIKYIIANAITQGVVGGTAYAASVATKSAKPLLIAKAYANLTMVLGVLALGIYRRHTDICDASVKNRNSWNKCMANAAEKAIKFEKESYNELKNGFKRIENASKREKKLEQLEKQHKKNMENLMAKLDKHNNATY